ncbi:occludin/ELL domain-containing protein 1 [Guaruba guarouba]
MGPCWGPRAPPVQSQTWCRGPAEVGAGSGPPWGCTGAGAVPAPRCARGGALLLMFNAGAGPRPPRDVAVTPGAGSHHGTGSGSQPGQREAKQPPDAHRGPSAPQICWEPMAEEPDSCASYSWQWQWQTLAPSPSGGCTMALASPASPAWQGSCSSSSSSRHCSSWPSASCHSKRGSTGMSLGVPPPPGAGTAAGDPPLRPPPQQPVSLTPLPDVLKPPAACARRVTFKDEVVASGRPTESISSAKGWEKPGASSVPPGLAPRPHALPDYVVRYPVIRSSQQREGYKGVFQDQLWEYTDLLWEIRSMLPRELEAGSAGKAPAAQWAHWGPAPSGRAPRAPGCVFAPQDRSRMAHVLHEYMRKKVNRGRAHDLFLQAPWCFSPFPTVWGSPQGTVGPWCQGTVLGSSWLSSIRHDWAFLAKQQRCEYLKQKLTHIKARIQEYDRDCAGTF